MLVKILFAVALVIVVFGIFVALRPPDFHITRNIRIAAPPATVFAQVDDLKKWNGWSPWAKKDPQMKQTFSGPATGVGSQQDWAGNSEVGTGRMTIMESQPNEKIGIRLEFFKPFAATNQAVLTFQPEGNQTVVTWTMTGKNNFMAKAAGLFLNIDKMVGDDFEKGLASLKAISEAAP